MSEVENQPLFITNLAGTEDLLLGYETVQQVRDGEIVNVTQINAHNIPYRDNNGNITTIGDYLDTLGGN